MTFKHQKNESPLVTLNYECRDSHHTSTAGREGGETATTTTRWKLIRLQTEASALLSDMLHTM